MSKKFKFKKRSQSKVVKFFKRKIRENGGLFTAFAVSSILGFIIQTFNLIFNKDITGGFMYVSMILGLGFIVEADIKRAFKRKNVRVLLPKVFTLLVGMVLFLSGLFSIPFFGITYGPTVLGILVGMNVVAAITLILEFIWID